MSYFTLKVLSTISKLALHPIRRLSELSQTMYFVLDYGKKLPEKCSKTPLVKSLHYTAKVPADCCNDELSAGGTYSPFFIELN